MTNWQGWLAALGGLASLIGAFVPLQWLVYLGGVVAIVFGAWAAMSK